MSCRSLTAEAANWRYRHHQGTGRIVAPAGVQLQCHAPSRISSLFGEHRIERMRKEQYR